MSHTLNGTADGFRVIAEALDPSVRFYPEPDEKALGIIAGEVFFRNDKMLNATNTLWEVDAVVEFSTAANLPGWSAAVRRIRDLTSPFGAKSLRQAVIQDDTLGGNVHHVTPIDRGLMDEARKKYHDGDRWTQEVWFRVRLKA